MRIGKGSNTLEMRLDGAYIPLLVMCAEFLGGHCTRVNAGRSRSIVTNIVRREDGVNATPV